MQVREIMTTDVECATPDMTLDEIAEMMRDEDTGAIPVVDDDELCGIITDRDIVIRCIADGEDPKEVTADEILSESLRTVEPDADVEQAARIMAEAQIRRLPVVENGKLVGMLSIGDIAVKQSDEELAGSTLEDVSEGVKATQGGQRRRGQSKPQPQIEAPHIAGLVGGGRQQRMKQEAGRKGVRGESRARPSRGLGARDEGKVDRSISERQPQGIANRGAREEQQRQNRVVPIRAESREHASRSAGKSKRGTTRRKAS